MCTRMRGNKVKLERNGEIVELSQQPHIDAFLRDGWKPYVELAPQPEVKKNARKRSGVSAR